MIDDGRLTYEEEAALFHAGKINEVLTANLPFARSLAKRYARGRLWLVDDLEQEARVGMTIAARHWDPAKGAKFTTYAYHWATRQIHEHLRITRRMVVVPRSETSRRVAAEMSKIDVRSVDDLLAVGVATKTSPARVADIFALLSSVDVGTVKHDDDGGEREYIASDSNPEEDVSTRELILRLRAAITTTRLSTAERRVIDRCFLDKDAATMKGLGRELRITKQRIAQVKDSAVAKIARRMKVAA